MSLLVNTLAAIAACTVFATGVLAHSAVVPVDKEPAPKLIVEPPLPDQLAKGVVFIPYRVENLRILPVAGPGASNVSPRVGHLHVTVDDLPWHWADAGDNATVVVADLPAGPHSVLIELALPDHQIIAGQTVSFVVPAAAPGGGHGTAGDR